MIISFSRNVQKLRVLIKRSFRLGMQSVCCKVLTVVLELCCFLSLASQSQAQPFDELKLFNWYQWRGSEAHRVSTTVKPPSRMG